MLFYCYIIVIVVVIVVDIIIVLMLLLLLLRLQPLHHPVQLLHASFGYTHLGVILADKGSIMPEVARRVGLGLAELRPLQRKLLCKDTLKLATRATIAGSIVQSQIFYNSEIWPALPKGPMKRLHDAVMRIHRAVTQCRTTVNDPGHYDNKFVLAQCDGMTAFEMIRGNRLRYFGRIVSLNRPELWTLVNLEQAWLRLVEEDIMWLWRRMRSTVELPEPTDIQAWQVFISQEGRHWPKLIHIVVIVGIVAVAVVIIVAKEQH